MTLTKAQRIVYWALVSYAEECIHSKEYVQDRHELDVAWNTIKEVLDECKYQSESD
jgi:hypothetical protein